MSHCQDFIWRPFILMHMCIGVVIVTCSVHMFCFFYMWVCVCMSSGHAFEKRMELGQCEFCFFPSTFLLSLIIHDMTQCNELGSLGHKQGLQQNPGSDTE